jgi:hypothetical protein
MSEEVIKDIPSYYIVLLIVMGFLVILLTPLHIPLQPWINPFAQNNPSEALSSIALLLLFSLITGSLGLLVRNSIIGNNGLNARLNYKKYKKRKEKEKLQEKLNPQALKEALKEAIWCRNNEAVDARLRFLSIKVTIIDGAILGAELAFIINLPFIGVSMFASRFNVAILLIIMPFIFGVPAYLYDKYCFRNELKQATDVVHDLFNESTNENIRGNRRP